MQSSMLNELPSRFHGIYHNILLNYAQVFALRLGMSHSRETFQSTAAAAAIDCSGTVEYERERERERQNRRV
jgi:hypothetical protein